MIQARDDEHLNEIRSNGTEGGGELRTFNKS